MLIKVLPDLKSSSRRQGFAEAFSHDRVLMIHDSAPWHNILSSEKQRIKLMKLSLCSPEL